MEMELWFRCEHILKPVPVSLFIAMFPYKCLYLERYVHSVNDFISGMGIEGSVVQIFHFPFYITFIIWMLENEQELFWEQNAIKVFPLWKHVSIHVYFKAGEMDLCKETVVLCLPSSSMGLIHIKFNLRPPHSTENWKARYRSCIYILTTRFEMWKYLHWALSPPNSLIIVTPVNFNENKKKGTMRLSQESVPKLMVRMICISTNSKWFQFGTDRDFRITTNFAILSVGKLIYATFVQGHSVLFVFIYSKTSSVIRDATDLITAYQEKRIQHLMRPSRVHNPSWFQK